MKLKQILRTAIILIILSSNIGCDQISKSIVRQRIGKDEEISLLSSYMTLTRVENSGAFLSTGHNLPQPLKLLLLTILPALVLGLGLVFVLTKKNLSNVMVVGVCCVVGGGIGNIYDRIMIGSVTDFVHIDFILFQTGVFNMADVSIMCGMALIIIDSYFKRAVLKEDPTERLDQSNEQ